MSASTPKPDDERRSGAGGASRLRDRIDRGGTGDKVAFSDPSAAPLGTDDEAAGTPPSREQVELAAAAEARRGEPADEKRSPSDLQAAPWSRASGWALAAGILCLAALGWALFG